MLLAAGVGYAGFAKKGPNQLAVGQVFKDCENCPSMIVVPAGSFMMGSPESEQGRLLDWEGPRQRVRIDKPFAVGRFEITVGQFREFLSETKIKAKRGCVSPWVRGIFDAKSRFSFEQPGFNQKDNEPAVCISWEDAQAYIAWLSKRTGHSYRLLSEAEWEYVARAGTETPYWWGGEITTENANFISVHKEKDLSDPNAIQGSLTVPVDSFSTNNFGLFNTLGNASEWTQDCWHKGYDGRPTDSSPWLSANGGDCTLRVMRGGSWSGNAKSLRAAFRDRVGANVRLTGSGFRVARDLSR